MALEEFDELRRLQRLRDRFLRCETAEEGVADYWRDVRDLRAYDAVFAQRIGWKWDAVLDAVRRELSGFAPTQAVDWGCGTAIASRRLVAHFPGCERVFLHDRSNASMDFAAQRLEAEHPDVEIARLAEFPGIEADPLLISHVLGEMSPCDEVALIARVRTSRTVIWVEPGSKAVARRLSAIRDLLRDEFVVLHPCPHQGPCAALENASDWCHFFATPPAEIFQSSDWMRLGRRLGLDLRSLPYHVLVLGRRDAFPDRPTFPAENVARMLGRPDLGNKEARVCFCSARGLERMRLVKSRNKELFRRMKKHANEFGLVRVEVEKDRLLDIEDLPCPP
ncbi:MAG TPA: hypothetical protein ENK43_16350 [Planctomycetes bacterium]|nr:hypothetical protein [Planctomycetota bacterium]